MGDCKLSQHNHIAICDHLISLSQTNDPRGDLRDWSCLSWLRRASENHVGRERRVAARVNVLAGASVTLTVAEAMLRALLRKNKLREQTSVSQAALKVSQAHREVVALYYWPSSGISKSGRGEIDLLEDG